MKNKKGLTLIELLIMISAIGIVLAIAIPNIKVKIEKNKAKNNRHGEYTMPVQEIKQQTKSSRVAISEVAQLKDLTLYIVKDLNNGNEYLITHFQQGSSWEGSVAIVLMPKEQK